MWSFLILAKCRRVTDGFTRRDFTPIQTLVIHVTYDWLTRVCLSLFSGIWILFSYHVNCQYSQSKKGISLFEVNCMNYESNGIAGCVSSLTIQTLQGSAIQTKSVQLPHIMAMHEHWNFFSQLFTCVAEGKAGLGVQSLLQSVRPSQNLVIATPLKLLIQLSWNLVCR